MAWVYMMLEAKEYSVGLLRREICDYTLLKIIIVVFERKKKTLT